MVCGILGSRYSLRHPYAARALRHPQIDWRRNMIGTESALETVSFYVNGKWEGAGNRTMHPVTNPATGAAIAQVAYASAADVDRAVQAAHAAFLKWRDVPVVERVQVLYRNKTLLESHTNDLAAVSTSENGKPADGPGVEGLG